MSSRSNQQMNKPVNSNRRAFSLSSIALLGWGGAVATLPRTVMAQAQAAGLLTRSIR